MDNEIDPTIIDELLLNGALEVRSIDEEGKFLYGFTEKAHELAPKIYNVFLDNFYSELMFLWEKEFLSMDVTKSNPVVTITEKAFDKNQIDALSIEHKRSLAFIMMAMKNE